MKQPRYDTERAVALVGSLSKLADIMGMDRREAYRYRRDGGFTAMAADRAAVALGLTPYELWPEMLDDAIEVEKRQCADERCGAFFLPERSFQRYCNRACGKRARARAYQERKRQDPAFREAKAERMRAYNASAGAVRRAKARRYYQINRERRIAWQRAYRQRTA